MTAGPMPGKWMRAPNWPLQRTSAAAAEGWERWAARLEVFIEVRVSKVW
jgi:hypothetical protein